MKNKQLLLQPIVLLIFLFYLSGCEDSDSGLAPYEGSTNMSNIQVEQGAYIPKITWVGGYVSAVGVNRGNSAALDSTLIWLIHIDGNDIKFPVTFGQLPQGAEDITEEYGGSKLDSLDEDFTYSYWVMKDDVWTKVADQKGSTIYIDSSLSTSVKIENDTIKLAVSSAAQKTQSIDLYINIENIQTFGRLADLDIIPVERSNNPMVTWTIKETGVTDPNISVIGMVEGQSYQIAYSLWEVWSEAAGDSGSIFGRNNVITSPALIGESLPGTRVFTEYSLEGLERDKNYYVWIANNLWNQEGRSRTTSGYAWVTFHTR